MISKPSTGSFAWGRLIVGADGNLYGVTQFGGDHALGNIFRVDGSGNVTNIHACLRRRRPPAAEPARPGRRRRALRRNPDRRIVRRRRRVPPRTSARGRRLDGDAYFKPLLHDRDGDRVGFGSVVQPTPIRLRYLTKAWNELITTSRQPSSSLKVD